jgi:hypothetical protein
MAPCGGTASEMNEIKFAVTALKGALDNVRTNADVARTNMLRLALKDARDQLARWAGCGLARCAFFWGGIN